MYILYIFLLPIIVITIFESLYNKKGDNSLSIFIKDKSLQKEETLSWFHILLVAFTPLREIISFGLLIELKKLSSINGFNLWSTLYEFNSVLPYIVVVLAFDFTQYWSHRLKHKFNIFWAAHRFHHSTKSMTTFSFARAHILNWPIKIITTNIPIIYIFGPDFFSIAWLSTIITFTQCLNHSRLRVNYGPLGFIFASPIFHIKHHNKESNRCNFGLIFSFWDTLFKTVDHDQHSFSRELGISDEDYQGNSILKSFFLDFKFFLTSLIQIPKDLITKVFLLCLIFTYPTPVSAASKRKDTPEHLAKITNSILYYQMNECQKLLDKRSCEELFYVFYKIDSPSVNNKLLLSYPFETICQFAKICHAEGKETCEILKRSLAPKKSCQSSEYANKKSSHLCNDLWSFRNSQCSKIKNLYSKVSVKKRYHLNVVKR